MPDVTSKEVFKAGQVLNIEVGPDERMAVFSDVPCTLEAMLRLKAAVDLQVALLKKGSVLPAAPPPAP